MEFIRQAGERAADVDAELKLRSVVFGGAFVFLFISGVRFSIRFEAFQIRAARLTRCQYTGLIPNHTMDKLAPIATRRIEIWKAPQTVEGQVLPKIFPVVGS